MDDGLFYVAYNGNEIVGTVMAGYDGRRGWIYSLAVKPDQHKQGVGKRLMAHAEAALRAKPLPAAKDWKRVARNES